MPDRSAAQQERRPVALTEPAAILAAMPEPVMVVGPQGVVTFANPAAEQFLQTALSGLVGQPLEHFLPADSPLFDLVAQVRDGGHSMSEHGLTLESPRIGARYVAVTVTAMGDPSQGVLIAIQERSTPRRIDDQLVHRNAARSVTAMGALLAHEVKNPLSGIRGAAQLLEQNAATDDRALTRLICDEADRIVALVDDMEMFADDRPLRRSAVNIHEVLNHVRRLAQSGFAAHVRFAESYDPSLPPVLGNRDLLVQLLLNLVKNAAEAVPAVGGEITLTTRYRQGVRMAVAGLDHRVELPLCIQVQDNGAGIPEAIRANLFEPFVTTKVGGKGLGLALVAKVVGDHGGVIDVESEPRRTVVRMMLPKARDEDDPR